MSAGVVRLPPRKEQEGIRVMETQKNVSRRFWFLAGLILEIVANPELDSGVAKNFQGACGFPEKAV